MSDANEYRPWEQFGEDELAYYKRRFLEESAEAERLRAVIAADCPVCGRALPGDGDCYGCQVDRLQAVVDAARKWNDYRRCRLQVANGFAVADNLEAALLILDGES